MPFRNIIVENPARISVKNSQLIIHTDREHSIPVEDVSTLMIESRQSTSTAAALSLLGECGCCVFVCDEKQYEAIEILLGNLTEADDSFQCEQLSIF